MADSTPRPQFTPSRPKVIRIPGSDDPIQVPEGRDVGEFTRELSNTIENDRTLKAELMQRLQTQDGVPGVPITGTMEERLRFFASQVDGPVVPGELDEIMVRADLARSDLVQEKLLKLEAAVANGTLPAETEFRVVKDFEGNDEILFRTPGETVFRQVSSPKLGQGDLGSLMGSVGAEDTAFEAIGFALTKRPGFGQAIKRAFGFGAAGELTKSGVESLRGFELSDIKDIAIRSALTGTAGSVGVGLTDPIVRMTNLIKGSRGLIQPTDEALGAIQATGRQNLPDLLPGSVHPTYKSMQQQVAGTSLVMEKAQEDQFASVVSRLAQLRDEVGDINKLDDATLDRLLEREKKNIMSAVRAPIGNSAVGGQELFRGISMIEDLMTVREVRAYDKALKEARDVTYDISTAKVLGNALKFGTRGKLKTKKGLRTINVGERPQKELREVIELLKKLDPNVAMVIAGGREFNPLDQMITMRTRLFNMKNDPDISGDQRQMANILWSELTNVISNPKGGTEAARNLWRSAANKTTFRENIMDLSFVRLIANTDTPGRLVPLLAKPFAADKLRLLRRIYKASGPETARKSGVPPEGLSPAEAEKLGLPMRRFGPFKAPDKWEAFREGFRADLLTDPGKIRGRLDAFNRDKESLDILLDSAEQRSFRLLGTEWSRLEKGTVAKLMREGLDVAQRTLELVQKGSRRELRELIAEAGGKTTPTGRALQAGVIESLLEKHTPIVKGRQLLDKRAFLNDLAGFRNRGILEDIFEPHTLRNIEDIELIASFLPEKMGAGEGIQKAGVAAGLTKITQFIQSNITLTKNRIMALGATTPDINKFLRGQGKPRPKLKADRIRAIAAMTGVIADNWLGLADTVTSQNLRQEPQ